MKSLFKATVLIVGSCLGLQAGAATPLTNLNSRVEKTGITEVVSRSTAEIKGTGASSEVISSREFSDPPEGCSAEIWWHWSGGNISREGITKDLEAMAAQGIRHATFFDVSMGLPLGTVPMMSDEWFKMVGYAAAEASRVGIKLGLHACPGWSELGGPWISPENSMKRLVWSQTVQAGDRTIRMDLPALPSNLGWSKDIVTLAWPTGQSSSRMEGGQVMSNGKTVSGNTLWDGNPYTAVDYGTDRFGWDTAFCFPQPYQADRLRLQTRWKAYNPPDGKVSVTVSADGRVILKKEIPGKELASELLLPFEPVTAKRFSFRIQLPADVQPWTTFFYMEISEAELLNGDELPQWEPELLNIFQQTGDSGQTGQPKWNDRKSSAPSLDPRQIINLNEFVNDGHLNWNAPSGNWRIVRFGFTTTGKNNGPARPGGQGLESDKMSAAATEFHFNSYVRPILNAAGKNRDVFDLLLTDSWEAGKQNWTDDFPGQFETRRGYAVWPYLAVAAGEVVGSREQTTRFLNDFRQTISDLVVERFYGKLGDLARAEGFKYAAELGDNGPDMDIFAAARKVDLPMFEFHSDKYDGFLPDIPAKVMTDKVSDAAFLAGKSIVPTESFTAITADFRRTPGDYGHLANVEFCKGYNQIVLHSYVQQTDSYKPPGLTLGRHGQAFNRRITWWPMIGDWVLPINRAQYLLQSGEPVYDVMVYCGDAMPGLLDAGALPEGCRRLRIDHSALMNRVGFQDGRLTFDGKGDYAAILFPSGNLFPETVEKIADLAEKGAAVGVTLPFRDPSWSDHEAQDQRLAVASRRLLGETGHPGLPRKVGAGGVYSAGDLEGIFNSRGYLPDCIGSVKGAGRSPLTYHKRSGNADIYLIVNPNHQRTSFMCEMADGKGRIPEIWDPETGKVSCITDAVHKNGRVVFPVDLEGGRSTFVVLRASSSEAVPVPVLDTPRELPINADWSTAFPGLPGCSELHTEHPLAWTDNSNPDIRDYSGIAVYEVKFNVSPELIEDAAKIELDLGNVSRVARVTVNGVKAGTLWREPWRLDVSGRVRSGENTLSIEVANTWLNRMLADKCLPETARSTWTSWDTAWWDARKATREVSGLWGPVRLLIYPAGQ